MALVTVTPILSTGRRLIPATRTFESTRIQLLDASSGYPARAHSSANSHLVVQRLDNPGQNDEYFVLETVAAIVAQTATGGGSTTEPTAPIADYATLILTPGTIGDVAYVVDASGDSNVDAGGASYMFNGTTWILTEADNEAHVFTVADIATRDAATPAIGDTFVVLDATADVGSAIEQTYFWTGSQFINLSLSDRYNDYATYADIATRDADGAVLDGDWAFVTDASADPLITAGSALYQRVNGAWNLQFNASGLSYVVYADIATRDAASPQDGDFGYVTDASADPLISSGAALYQYVNGAWTQERDNRYNDYAVFADIATRDAVAAVDVEDGDWAFVTDASADPLITAGSGLYQRVNGAWVLQYNASGLSYVVYADITARDAASPNDGDFGYVTDASSEADVSSGAATYQYINGSWERDFSTMAPLTGQTFTDFASDATLNPDLDLSTLDFTESHSIQRAFGGGGTLTFSSGLGGIGNVGFRSPSIRTLIIRNSALTALAVDTTDLPPQMDGTSYDAISSIPAGENVVLFLVNVGGTDIDWTVANRIFISSAASAFTYNSVADITARDALTPTEGDTAYVVDASGDAEVTSGAAYYEYVNGAWQIQRNERDVRYTIYADIATRDAAAAVDTPDGDFAYVTDASADPLVTAGAQLYQRVDGAWIFGDEARYNDYAVYAAIAARDAAPAADTPDGDWAFVTDASADAFVSTGSAVYQRVNSTWVLRVGTSASPHLPFTPNRVISQVQLAGSITQDLSAIDIEQFELFRLTAIAGTTDISFSNALPSTSLPDGTERMISVDASLAAAMTGDISGLPVYVNGEAARTGSFTISATRPLLIVLRAVGGEWLVEHTSYDEVGASTGLSYTVFADIATRDAATVNDGDFGFVTDASADPNVLAGDKLYQFVDGAWVAVQDGFEYLIYADIATRDADTSVTSGDICLVIDSSADVFATGGNVFYVLLGGNWVGLSDTGTTNFLGASMKDAFTPGRVDLLAVATGTIAIDFSTDVDFNKYEVFSRFGNGTFPDFVVTGLLPSANGNLPVGTKRFFLLGANNPAASSVDFSGVNAAMVDHFGDTFPDDVRPMDELPAGSVVIEFTLDQLGAWVVTNSTFTQQATSPTSYRLETTITNRDASAAAGDYTTGDIVQVLAASTEDPTVASGNGWYLYEGGTSFRRIGDNYESLAGENSTQLGLSAIVTSISDLSAFDIDARQNFAYRTITSNGTVAFANAFATPTNAAAASPHIKQFTLVIDDNRTIDTSGFPPMGNGEAYEASVVATAGDKFTALLTYSDSLGEWVALTNAFPAATAAATGLTMGAEQAAGFTATIATEHPVNSTGGVITVDPPAAPVADDEFAVFDSRSQAAANNITVDFVSAGQPYNGAADNAVLAANKDFAKFRYVDATIGWRLSR
jgi:hypothetical protein